MTFEKMTEEDKIEIKKLGHAIYDATKGANPTHLMQALTFCLLGAIRTQYKLTERGAVEFCSKAIKTWGQFEMS